KGLSFRDKGDLTYRYKLEGLDTSWVFTKYTSIKYQALPPGKYKFIVSVSNHDKLYSESKNFEIIIIPGWWQTVWFKAIVILMFIICMFFILRWYFKKLRGREEEKNKFQHKISEAELKALRAQMNPHFIFNAIASVQYFISGNDPKSSQKYLSKFAKLIRYVVDNSKPETIPLKTEIEALTLYLELESLRFENKFEYEIKLEDHIDLNFTQIPSMLIQPFVENAIWHGLMHKKTKGKIIISFYLKDNLLECTIHDDGVGRKKSKEMKTESALKNHKSIGMALTRERLEILNQIYNITLDYSVQDTINKNNEVTGTIVKIQIPLN
ncbi:MAG: hypothetical protein JWO32_1934, partial [Bacteroidetes bacterium]|nr:hypothetical protein [Bacteroidota bacterium]